MRKEVWKENESILIQFLPSPKRCECQDHVVKVLYTHLKCTKILLKQAPPLEPNELTMQVIINIQLTKIQLIFLHLTPTQVTFNLSLTHILTLTLSLSLSFILSHILIDSGNRVTDVLIQPYLFYFLLFPTRILLVWFFLAMIWTQHKLFIFRRDWDHWLHFLNDFLTREDSLQFMAKVFETNIQEAEINGWDC